MSKQTDIKMVNKTTFSDKLKTYLKHPGSFIVMLLVLLAAVITFAVLIFLIAYILINGRIIIAIVNAPARRENPHPSVLTKNNIPNRPYTIDGIP